MCADMIRKERRLPIARTIFRGGKYRSDADVPVMIPIVDASAKFRLSSGTYRGVLVIRVKRLRGYQRVYLRGVAAIRVERLCQCCSTWEVSGTFERQVPKKESR